MPVENLNNIASYLLSHKYENKYYRKGPNSCSGIWRDVSHCETKKESACEENPSGPVLRADEKKKTTAEKQNGC